MDALAPPAIVVHRIPGRVRLRVARLGEDGGYGPALEATLRRLPGVRAVRVAAGAASVIVELVKAVDDRVFAATVISDGKIYVKAERVGAVTFAASTSARQTHPVSQAVTRLAQSWGLEIPERESSSYFVGKGVESRVNGRTVQLGSQRFLAELGIADRLDSPRRAALDGEAKSLLFLAVDGAHTATLAYRDEIRPESRRLILDLRARGVDDIVMLTGDGRAVAQHVARELGIVPWFVFDFAVLPNHGVRAPHAALLALSALYRMATTSPYFLAVSLYRLRRAVPGFSIRHYVVDYWLAIYPFLWASCSESLGTPLNLHLVRRHYPQVPSELRLFVVGIGGWLNLNGTMICAFIMAGAVARILGHDLSLLELLLAVPIVFLIGYVTPGLPGELIPFAAPMAAALNIPGPLLAPFIAIYIGFNFGLPDSFRTGQNSTDNCVSALRLIGALARRRAPAVAAASG